MEDKYKVLAEQVLRLFSGGDASDDSGWDLREIELLVAQAHAMLVRNEYFTNLKTEGQHSVGAEHYTTFVKVPVVFDTERKEDYTLLPAQFISIPGNKGIHQVAQYGKPGALPILPVNPGMASMLEGTRAGGMNGRLMYYPEGNRIFFRSTCELPFKFVNIRLLLPSGKSVSLGQELAIMGEVTKLMAQRRPQDKTNDNNQTV
jgi:hypothetical protein